MHGFLDKEISLMPQVNSSKGKEAKRRLKLFLLLVFAFLAWAGYTVINQSNQKDAVRDKYLSIEKERNQIKEQVTALQTQVQLLNDSEYISQLATKEQGMVHEGEKQIFTD